MNPTFAQVEKQLLSYPGAYLDYPFGEGVAVYKLESTGKSDKMFALLVEQRKLLRLSLKCDPNLAELLRQKYESVLPGYHLPKRHWNTIVLSGQLSWPEVVDLIDHSHQLVSGRPAA